MVLGPGAHDGCRWGWRMYEIRERWEAVRSPGALLAVESKEIGMYSQGSGEIEGLKQGRDVT